MKLCEMTLCHKIYEQVQSILPAYEGVKAAWEKRKEVHPSGEIMFLDVSCPWKSHVNKIEEENETQGEMKFVLYKDGRGMHRIQCVPKKVGEFGDRCSLAESFRGLRDEALSKAVGITDGAFCHATGFIGGAWSLESVIKMGEMSIEAQKAKEAEVKTNGFVEPEEKKQRVE